MTREAVQRWLDAYVSAWRSYDPEAIGVLFAEDATYRYHPYDEPLRGRAAIVESWRGEPDAAGSWQAAYAPHLVTDELVIARGRTDYAGGERYWNLFELRFDGSGRCTDFTEWYMLQRSG